jgi:hypothetical protein
MARGIIATFFIFGFIVSAAYAEDAIVITGTRTYKRMSINLMNGLSGLGNVTYTSHDLIENPLVAPGNGDDLQAQCAADAINASDAEVKLLGETHGTLNGAEYIAMFNKMVPNPVGACLAIEAPSVGELFYLQADGWKDLVDYAVSRGMRVEGVDAPRDATWSPNGWNTDFRNSPEGILMRNAFMADKINGMLSSGCNSVTMFTGSAHIDTLVTTPIQDFLWQHSVNAQWTTFAEKCH